MNTMMNMVINCYLKN